MRQLTKIIFNPTAQLTPLKKLYYSHIWISEAESDGYHQLGISDYAKRHFVRMCKINYELYPKTNYSIKNRQYIALFIEQTKEKKNKGELAHAQRIEWERFTYKKGEAFATLETVQFDLELLAPLDMRVVEFQFNSYYRRNLLTSPYYFKIEALNKEQLSLLASEQQYQKSRKMIF